MHRESTMAITHPPFSPRPLGPLDTRRRRRARRLMRRVGPPMALGVILAVCLATGWMWASGRGLDRAMHLLGLGQAPAQTRLASAGPGVVYHLGLPLEYSARVQPSTWPQDGSERRGEGVSQ
jgi:hypothetical protein